MSELFDAFGIDWRLLVIQAVNFGLLLAALTYFLYKPILSIIDERQRKIAEGVRTAQAADQQLADAKLESDEIVGSAGREAEGMLAEARAAAALKEAEARGEETKRQALKESEGEIARAAMLAAEKILRKETA